MSGSADTANHKTILPEFIFIYASCFDFDAWVLVVTYTVINYEFVSSVHAVSRKNTKMVRDLWWCGLPASIRGQVWKLAAANELNITSGNIVFCFTVTVDLMSFSALSEMLRKLNSLMDDVAYSECKHLV